MNMYLKVNDNGDIIGHSTGPEADMIIKIDVEPSDLFKDDSYQYKYVSGNLVKLSRQDKKVHPLRKNRKIREIRALSFNARKLIIDDYKLVNAALGVYDDETVARYRTIIRSFRNEVNRVNGLIQSANTGQEMDAAIDSLTFPDSL